MIKERTFYAIACDRCGTICEDSDGNSYCNDISDAEDLASNEDWQEIDKKWYCTDCYFEYDECKFVPLPPIADSENDASKPENELANENNTIDPRPELCNQTQNVVFPEKKELLLQIDESVKPTRLYWKDINNIKNEKES
jgi:hypothetical protein